MPESSPDGWVLSDAALQKVIKAVRQTLGRPLNQRDDRGAGKPFTAVQWFPFLNDSGETVPSRGIVKIVADIQTHEVGDEIVNVVYKGDKPDTTFAKKYGICWPFPVEDGEVGFLTFDGPQWMPYDSGTPAIGEGWGPKPGQWTLSKGFPGAIVDGIIDSTDKLLLGTLSPITALLGKTTGAITGGTSTTTAYRIWTGTSGSEADGGWTTVPGAITRVDIGTTKFVKLTWVNNGWIMEPLECG